jgi:hypothetical protein
MKRIDVVCPYCNETFSTYSLKPARFCSRDHYMKYLRTDPGSHVDSICEFCGKTYSRIKSQPTRFCGRDCYNNYMEINKVEYRSDKYERYRLHVKDIVDCMRDETYVYKYKVIEKLPQSLKNENIRFLRATVSRSMGKCGLKRVSKANSEVYVWSD